MNKIKIRIISVGHLPADVDINSINSWKSDIFELQSDVEHFELRANSDIEGWAYSDDNIAEAIPEKGKEDILVALVAVPLEDNYYTRRINNNTIISSFHETSDYLRTNNIPLENIILRLLYAYTLVYLKYSCEIPTNDNFSDFTHDETRGCIYDMNGLKEDITVSCEKPIICPECVEKLTNHRVSQTIISTAKKELKKIKKQLFYRIFDLVKSHPIITIFISSLWAIILGIVGSAISKCLLK